MYVSLDKDVMLPTNQLAYAEVHCRRWHALISSRAGTKLYQQWSVTHLMLHPHNCSRARTSQALGAGVKALKVLGITGIAVDIYWGLVEVCCDSTACNVARQAALCSWFQICRFSACLSMS